VYIYTVAKQDVPSFIYWFDFLKWHCTVKPYLSYYEHLITSQMARNEKVIELLSVYLMYIFNNTA